MVKMKKGVTIAKKTKHQMGVQKPYGDIQKMLNNQDANFLKLIKS